MPQAIGVAASQPGRPAIALCGDGGLAMLMGDLLTLPQLKLPVKIVVFNNGALSFVELEMKAAGLVDYGTNLENPSFAAVGEAMGIKSFRVDDAAALEPALRAALAHDGPALVDVVVARQELSMPPSIDVSQAWGFGLYMAKAILSGRGDEIVDLAKTNLPALISRLKFAARSPSVYARVPRGHDCENTSRRARSRWSNCWWSLASSDC